MNQRVYSELRWSARGSWMNLDGPELWVIHSHFATYWYFDCLAIAASLLGHARKTQQTAQGGDFRISPDPMSRDGFRKNYFVFFNYTIRSMGDLVQQQRVLAVSQSRVAARSKCGRVDFLLAPRFSSLLGKSNLSVSTPRLRVEICEEQGTLRRHGENREAAIISLTCVVRLS